MTEDKIRYDTSKFKEICVKINLYLFSIHKNNKLFKMSISSKI